MASGASTGLRRPSSNHRAKYTATIGLVRQMTTMGVSFNVMGAAATMMAAPMLIFLTLMQRQFVRGLTAGALEDA